MFYEIDKQLDHCTDHAVHNSTLTYKNSRSEKNQSEHNIPS